MLNTLLRTMSLHSERTMNAIDSLDLRVPVSRTAVVSAGILTASEARSYESGGIVEPVPAPALPPMPQKPAAGRAEPSLTQSDYDRYAAAADAVGFVSQEALIERVKLLLVKHDIPVYDLTTVVAYMDALAARENPTGYGWQWVPLRPVDGQPDLSFGTGSRLRHNNLKTPASDYFAYYSEEFGARRTSYDKVVPVRALERVALLEGEIGPNRVAFAVSDYATEPHRDPDPFLMLIVPNKHLREGVGRFVIDVWNEPGFGIMEMIR